MAGYFDSGINRMLAAWGHAQPPSVLSSFMQSLPSFSQPQPLPTYQAPRSLSSFSSPMSTLPTYAPPRPLQYSTRRDTSSAGFAKYPAKPKAVVAPREGGPGGPGGTGAGTPVPTDTPGTPVPGTNANVLRWLPLADQYARQNGIPVALVLAIMQNESGGDPQATSGMNPGQGQARGLMQLMPFHFKPGDNPYDPDTNLRIATAYLGDIYKRRGGDPEKTMAEYFGGGNAFDQAGNIRRDIGDINIKMGAYLDQKFKPSYSVYQQEVARRQQPIAQPKQTTGTAAWQQAYQNGTLTPDQFGGGLDAAAALSACGPAAAVAFARANGRNPTLAEAVELAKRVGWNPNSGMAGAQSQVNLLNQMGVASSITPGVNWQHVQQELAAGRPVIIDTPRHYLVAEGYDAETGMFNFGNSGRALKTAKGRSWFTPAQVAALGLGQLRSTITMGGQRSASVAPGTPVPPGPPSLEGWTGGRAYTITGEFGQRDPDYPAAGHGGMDIATPTRTPLTAGVGGTVVHAGGDYNRGGYGNAVVLRTADNHLIILGHLTNASVQVGQQVAPGATLGLSGSTGKSTGPHLHLEVRDPNGRQTDPRGYFARRSA